MVSKSVDVRPSASARKISVFGACKLVGWVVLFLFLFLFTVFRTTPMNGGWEECLLYILVEYCVFAAGLIVLLIGETGRWSTAEGNGAYDE